MSDYADLIQSLRCCATNKCESCPYEKKYSYRCATPLVMDAAAAIEGLVESVHIRDKHLDELNQYIWKLEAEVERLQVDLDAAYALMEAQDGSSL